LIEAMRDGRLGAADEASLERHISTCALCKDAARELDRIGELLRAPLEPATPLEHQRARLDLLSRAARSHASPPARRPAVIAFAAAALAIAACAGFFVRGVVSPNAPVAAVTSSATSREAVVVGSNGAKFARSTADERETIALATGTVDVTLRALNASERFVVKTNDAEIEAHAGVFRVESVDGHVRNVAVIEGKVEVRYAAFHGVIPSGGSWSVADVAVTPQAEPTAVAAQPKEDPAPSNDASEPRAAKNDARTAKNDARVAKNDAAPLAAVKAPAAAKPVPANDVTPPAASAAPKPLGPTAASREFGDALHAIERGDFNSASAVLDAFSADHPSDARADEADYLRAVSLQRAKRTSDAIAAARHYLAKWARGAHRAEAQVIADGAVSPP
jgi:TolA-binding protein